MCVLLEWNTTLECCSVWILNRYGHCLMKVTFFVVIYLLCIQLCLRWSQRVARLMLLEIDCLSNVPDVHSWISKLLQASFAESVFSIPSPPKPRPPPRFVPTYDPGAASTVWSIVPGSASVISHPEINLTASTHQTPLFSIPRAPACVCVFFVAFP